MVVPRLSVVVPAHNAGATLERCLASLLREVGEEGEVLLVDDGSTDRTEQIARAFGLEPIRREEPSGPAAARNLGARRARAPVLLFVDADTEARPGLARRALGPIERGEVDAVIGSYDDDPASPTVVSRFKNLAHHFLHQESAGPVATFWGACGSIRRDLFLEVGGFDALRFPRPSVEDIELGWRLHERGASIRLDPELRVRHLKRWTLRSLIATDLLRRAVPWTRLCLERARFPRTLNLSGRQRAAALAALLLTASLGSAAWAGPAAGWAVGPALLLAVGLNLRLFHLFWSRGGPRLAVAGFLLQQLYYLYSWLGLALGTVAHLTDRPAGRARESSECS